MMGATGVVSADRRYVRIIVGADLLHDRRRADVHVCRPAQANRQPAAAVHGGTGTGTGANVPAVPLLNMGGGGFGGQ